MVKTFRQLYTFNKKQLFRVQSLTEHEAKTDKKLYGIHTSHARKNAKSQNIISFIRTQIHGLNSTSKFTNVN